MVDKKSNGLNYSSCGRCDIVESGSIYIDTKDSKESKNGNINLNADTSDANSNDNLTFTAGAGVGGSVSIAGSDFVDAERERPGDVFHTGSVEKIVPPNLMYIFIRSLLVVLVILFLLRDQFEPLQQLGSFEAAEGD